MKKTMNPLQRWGRGAVFALALLGNCAAVVAQTNDHDEVVRARYEAASARQKLAISEHRNAIANSDLALADAAAKRDSLRVELGCARIVALEMQLQRVRAQMPQLSEAYAMGKGNFSGCQAP